MGNRYYPIGDKELASVTTITGLADKSDALIPWAVNCAVDYVEKVAEHFSPFWRIHDRELDDARTKWREVRDEAGDIGTQVHDMLEAYLNAIKSGDDCLNVEGTNEVRLLFKSAREKLNELGDYTVLATEQKVVNEDEWYAGRFDALLEVEVPHTEKWEGREVSTTVKETWLIDFKTGGAFYPEWGMQLAAYAEAWDKARFECLNWEGRISEFKGVDRIKVLRLDKKILKAHWKEYGGEKDTLTRENYMTAFRGLRDAFYVLRAKKAVKQAWLER
jgi:hypothetical protein